jgi:hypothetical protein
MTRTSWGGYFTAEFGGENAQADRRLNAGRVAEELAESLGD